MTREIACSHLRAWRLFLESVGGGNESCRFIAWPCPKGRTSYVNGLCFPMDSTAWTKEMGYRANIGPLGIYYLPTRGEEPFCGRNDKGDFKYSSSLIFFLGLYLGQPLRASVTISEDTPRTSGSLYLKIDQRNSTTTFKLRCM